MSLVGGCTTAGPPGVAGLCVDTFDDIVTNIVDGDTLDVAECGRIRLALVDTPERGQEGYENATDFTRAVCPVGANATVDIDSGQPMDTTGTRRVAVVFCGGDNLNAELLVAGHAVILVQFCDESEFTDEEWAREQCARPD